MAKKYTVMEIDRMREAIRWSYPTGVPYYDNERNSDIENRLRTYMQNGTTVEELEVSMSNKMKVGEPYRIYRAK